MSFLVRGSKIYEKILHDQESHYEDIVEHAFNKILCNFRLYRYRRNIVPQDKFIPTRRPDYLLISNDYTVWYIVEVELASHSLESHVRPQIEAFTQGELEGNPVEHIVQNNSNLDSHRLERLLLYRQPEVIVVVNDRRVLRKNWQILEDRYGAHLLFIEVYRAEDDEPQYFYSGYFPKKPAHIELTAFMHDFLNALELNKPLIQYANNTITISYDGVRTAWRAVEEGKLLIPTDYVNLKRKTKYSLRIYDDETIELVNT